MRLGDDYCQYYNHSTCDNIRFLCWNMVQMMDQIIIIDRGLVKEKMLCFLARYSNHRIVRTKYHNEDIRVE